VSEVVIKDAKSHAEAVKAIDGMQWMFGYTNFNKPLDQIVNSLKSGKSRKDAI
jgi:hypothetical protein